MEIETEIEIKTPPPKNHKWEFLRFGKASKGDSFVDNRIVGIWNTYKSTNSYPIVEPVRTHRDSGIPIELPDAEPPEGYVFGKMGWGLKCEGEFINSALSEDFFHRGSDGGKGFQDVFYIDLIKKPTTLTDLVGENGEKNVWVLMPSTHEEGTTLVITADIGVVLREDGTTAHLTIGGETIKHLEAEGVRWSNSPFTKYENANEFVI